MTKTKQLNGNRIGKFNLYMLAIMIMTGQLVIACSSNISQSTKHTQTQHTCTTPKGESKTVGYFYSEDRIPHFIDLTFDGKTYHLEESPASGQIYLTQTNNDTTETDKEVIVTAHKMGILVEEFEGNSNEPEVLFSCEF